jgi:uncharacterized RDD family membrane protein YckC
VRLGASCPVADRLHERGRGNLIVQKSSAFPGHVAKTELVYAGFWRRALAYVIDATFLGGVAVAMAGSIDVLAPDNFQAAANIFPVSAALCWAYFAMLESSPAQGTIGKIVLNLRVADTHGDPITFRRASFRNVFKIFSSLIVGTGWLLAAFAPRKQALHDLLAGTVVLREIHYIAEGPVPPSEPGDHWDGAGWVASAPPLERS